MARTGRPTTTSNYIADHLGELKLLAQNDGLDVLAHFIQMAELQARDDEKQGAQGKKSSSSRPTDSPQ